MLGVGGIALTDLRRELLGRDQLAVTAFRSVILQLCGFPPLVDEGGPHEFPAGFLTS